MPVSLFTEGAPGGVHRLAPLFASAVAKTFGTAKKSHRVGLHPPAHIPPGRLELGVRLPAGAGFDALLWLAESEQYLIRPAANARIENSPFVVIVGITKRVTLRFEHESCRFNLALHADRIDSMQCFRIP
jgi:hypothetical protein